ncbi:MAG: MBL fold metallo-hydrolase [Anaerovoracaceae bacterium]
MNLSFCSFASGSSGNCYLIKSRESAILIDAGISTKKIHAALEELGTERSEISGVFVTHEHSDHVKGLKVLTKQNPLLERLCQRRNLSLSSGDRT